jgi:minor histocompatibility antigen H13
VCLPLPLSLSLSPLFPPYQHGDEISEEERVRFPKNDLERMADKDVWKFPLIASAFLFSLYLVYKFVPKYYVNIIIKAYFFLFGTLVLAQALHKFFHIALPLGLLRKLDTELARVWIPLLSEESEPVKDKDGKEKVEDDGKVSISVLYLISLGASIAIAVWYIKANHWSANNLLGIAFAIQGIEMISLGSFLNASILLCGLFFYDIFWVFGTDVMVTVAKSFDGPIKLLFPRGGDGVPPSLLGLGDIVIPGIFIAMMLRFDYHRALEQSKPLSKVYFNTSMVGYFAGLSLTVAIMTIFHAAQPALLYLVPTCLLSTIGVAFFRGELKQLISMTEGEDESEEEDEQQDQAASKKDK